MERGSVESDILALDVLKLDVASIPLDPQMLLEDGIYELGDDLVLLDAEPGEADDGGASRGLKGSPERHGHVRDHDDVHVGLGLVQGLGHHSGQLGQQTVQVGNGRPGDVGFQAKDRHFGWLLACRVREERELKVNGMNKAEVEPVI